LLTLRFPTTRNAMELFTQFHKRGSGCTEINSTTYTTEGVAFDILCDTDFGSSSGNNALTISYTTDFATCINACVTWNKMNSQKCVGVSWEEPYGPLGVAGGRACRSFWTLIGNFASPGVDSAFIQGAISPAVRPYIIWQG
jgi:hypothetical protein